MYTRYAEGRRWRVEIIDLNETGIRGVKEVSAIVEGRGAYSRLKYETGVHRVQRVPETEAQGRIHTSAVTVAVLPEAEDVEVEIDEKDLRIDRYCSSGPGRPERQHDLLGGAHHPPAHRPGGARARTSAARSRTGRRRCGCCSSRLLEIERARAEAEIAAERRKMVGSGDRSEKIRTYNFPQNRVTDHRIGLTLHQLPAILEGDLDPLIEPLAAHFDAERMREATPG